MNYQNIYNQIIKVAQARASIKGYFERHHIVPRCLGGSDASSNLVDLTAREHFLAHILLAKVHGGDLWLPVVRMKTAKDGSKANGRLYAMARAANAVEVGNRLRGTKLTPEHKEKIGKSQKGCKRAPEVGRKIAEALRGKPKSAAHKSAVAAAIKGTKRSGESPLKGRKQSVGHIAKRVAKITGQRRVEH